jgi:hypothetical protein
MKNNNLKIAKPIKERTTNKKNQRFYVFLPSFCSLNGPCLTLHVRSCMCDVSEPKNFDFKLTRINVKCLFNMARLKYITLMGYSRENMGWLRKG